HGGVDPGTVYLDIYEKDINLEISLKLEEELTKLGALVIMTRNGDYDLSSPGVTMRKLSDFNNRIKLINESGASIYLSIHMNYINDSKYGETVIFYRDDQTLASLIQEEINKELNYSREIKEIPSTTYMYSKLDIPGVLIECGFLSNYNDRTNFLDEEFQQKFAQIIANSITKYY
ncbi:MAG: N-acetylmuramoyl-L-alanine amidase, partial [bacterium]